MEVTKHTPLYHMHKDLGAKFVSFGGWEMPVWYMGIIEEHRAVRTSAGLFDVSHMGEILLEGKGALATVQRLITNDARTLAVGQVHYAAMCNGKGGIIDDLTVYRLQDERFMFVVNAANIEKDYRWMKRYALPRTTLRNISDEVALIALQGPMSETILQQLTTCNLRTLGYYRFAQSEICNMPCRISRTGYTGEDGFELYCDAYDAPEIWTSLLTAGKPYGLVPCGLGSRDTLRLEAGMMLHGNDIDETHTPLEAPLSWVVKLEKKETFVGKRALLRQKKQGVTRKLAGFELVERGIARQHYPIVASDGAVLGEVTSGTLSPTLGKAIGMGYVPQAHAAPGTEFFVMIRGETVRARVVKLPFYRRKKNAENTV